MRKQLLFLASAALLFTGCRKEETMREVVERGLNHSARQVETLVKALEAEPDSLPRSFDKDGRLIKSDAHWWCSGFFPGTLWYLYEGTGRQQLKHDAERYTARVESQQYTTDNHDIGFILYCSFGNGYRLTGNEAYARVLLQGAESLSTRFNPRVGLIRSWDHNTEKWQYPVIIDNMMNLELLEWASKHSDSIKYADIARSHARVTMKHHFREDHSSYHVVSYDPLTGEPEKKNTHQGLSDASAWSRGQAWGLYGYTMMYRETGDKAFLEQARDIARFILNHPRLPADKIPYWDFDSPDIPNTPRDASAGAIMASAFIELSLLTRESDPDFSGKCLATAETQLRTLSSEEYLAATGSNGGFILKHSVGNFPAGREVDVPLTYADYYYVEALVRYKHSILKTTAPTN